MIHICHVQGLPERPTAAIQLELDSVRMQHKISLAKVWGLEECLSVKDAELQVKEAELNHLR